MSLIKDIFGDRKFAKATFLHISPKNLNHLMTVTKPKKGGNK